MRYCAPNFICAIPLLLFRVGLCSHGITILKVTWRHHEHQTRSRGVDRVDWSPRDQYHNMCVNPNLSEMDLPLIWRHLDGSGVLDLHRTDGDGRNDAIFSVFIRSRSPSDGRN